MFKNPGWGAVFCLQPILMTLDPSPSAMAMATNKPSSAWPATDVKAAPPMLPATLLCKQAMWRVPPCAGRKMFRQGTGANPALPTEQAPAGASPAKSNSYRLVYIPLKSIIFNMQETLPQKFICTWSILWKIASHQLSSQYTKIGGIPT